MLEGPRDEVNSESERGVVSITAIIPVSEWLTASFNTGVHLEYIGCPHCKALEVVIIFVS